MCDKLLVNVKKNGELRFYERTERQEWIDRSRSGRSRKTLMGPFIRPFYTKNNLCLVTNTALFNRSNRVLVKYWCFACLMADLTASFMRPIRLHRVYWQLFLYETLAKKTTKTNRTRMVLLSCEKIVLKNFVWQSSHVARYWETTVSMRQCSAFSASATCVLWMEMKSFMIPGPTRRILLYVFSSVHFRRTSTRRVFSWNRTCSKIPDQGIYKSNIEAFISGFHQYGLKTLRIHLDFS